MTTGEGRGETQKIGTAGKALGQGLSGQKIIRSAELENQHIYRLRGPRHSTDPLKRLHTSEKEKIRQCVFGEAY